jgi:hypothetical protein
MPDPIKKAKYPKAASFIEEHVSLPNYRKVFMPGESELTARLLGIEPKYEYSNYMEIPKEMYSEEVMMDKKLWDVYVDKAWKKLSDEVVYRPEESPLREIDVNKFIPNPETKHGRDWQDRIDLSYSQARVKNVYGYNPDKNYKYMLKGQEELLGDIFFDEEGNFEDIWNISVDEHEPILTPTNLIRRLGAPLFEMNVPTITGRATYKGLDPHGTRFE